MLEEADTVKVQMEEMMIWDDFPEFFATTIAKSIAVKQCCRTDTRPVVGAMICPNGDRILYTGLHLPIFSHTENIVLVQTNRQNSTKVLHFLPEAEEFLSIFTAANLHIKYLQYME